MGRPDVVGDDADEMLKANRLQQVVIGLQLAVDDIAERRAGGDDGGNACEPRIHPLLVSKAPAVHLRHHQIEEDEADLCVGAEQSQAVGAAGGLGDVETRAAKSFGQRFADFQVIVDDQDAPRTPFVIRCQGSCFGRLEVLEQRHELVLHRSLRFLNRHGRIGA